MVFRTDEIREFILQNVKKHPRDLAKVTQKKFELTRPAVLRHIRALIDSGKIKAEGKTKDRRYTEIPLVKEYFQLSLSEKLEEHVIWIEKIRPLLKEIPSNVLRICEYGFTEMVNNAIDHSRGSSLLIYVEVTYSTITFLVADNGIGIFNKLQTELQLENPRDAILELYKGKLTTDPNNHSGEGIFFTSRMFDNFSILSGKLSFTHTPGEKDFLFMEDFAEDDDVEGTAIVMRISTSSKKTTKQVLDRFSVDDNLGFTRTIVPVFLAKHGGENLVSRSQAKRLLARLDKFEEIWLDFTDVKTIGQAFADEIFRVYQNKHPKIVIKELHANSNVEAMISRVRTT